MIFSDCMCNPSPKIVLLREKLLELSRPHKGPPMLAGHLQALESASRVDFKLGQNPLVNSTLDRTKSVRVLKALAMIKRKINIRLVIMSRAQSKRACTIYRWLTQYCVILALNICRSSFIYVILSFLFNRLNWLHGAK